MRRVSARACKHVDQAGRKRIVTIKISNSYKTITAKAAYKK